MEPDQLLKVTVKLQAVWGSTETFHAKISQDGRMIIPKIIMQLLNSKPTPENPVLDVTLEPA